MKTTKKCRVVKLPTKKETPLCMKWESDNKESKNIKCIEYSHLYLISLNEEIKEGDKVYHTELNIIGTVNSFIEENNYSKYWLVDEKRKAEIKLLKIIATTDKSLIKKINAGKDIPLHQVSIDYLPQIPESFVKAYVEANGEIDEVQVEYESFNSHHIGNERLKTRDDNTVIIHKIKEEMFTKQEVIQLLSNLYDDTDNNYFHKNNTIEEWVKLNL